MANIKSKKKSILTQEKARLRNSAYKSQVRKAIKKTKIAALSNDSELPKLLAEAHKLIDKSVSKGIYHKNNGARKASKLDMFVQKAQQTNSATK